MLQAPCIHLHRVSPMELGLLCDAMSVTNRLRSQKKGLVDHDFSSAEHQQGELKVGRRWPGTWWTDRQCEKGVPVQA